MCDPKIMSLLFPAVLQWILGANVHWHNMERLPQGRYVMISNHQTAGDLLSLYQLPHRIIHLVSAGIPKAATEVKNHRLRLWYATAEVFSELAEPNQEDPVHLFPGVLALSLLSQSALPLEIHANLGIYCFQILIIVPVAS